jgi:hypothetical protein
MQTSQVKYGYFQYICFVTFSSWKNILESLLSGSVHFSLLPFYKYSCTVRMIGKPLLFLCLNSFFHFRSLFLFTERRHWSSGVMPRPAMCYFSDDGSLNIVHLLYGGYTSIGKCQACSWALFAGSSRWKSRIFSPTSLAELGRPPDHASPLSFGLFVISRLFPSTTYRWYFCVFYLTSLFPASACALSSQS